MWEIDFLFRKKGDLVLKYFIFFKLKFVILYVLFFFEKGVYFIMDVKRNLLVV